jgi:putative transcriptional regulator
MLQSNLMTLRKKNNVTQKELASKLNISNKAYSYKELGKTEFTMNEMFIIADYFKEKIDKIFLPKNTPKRSK